MIKWLLVFFYITIPLLAIEIDYKTLEEIIQNNPSAYKEKSLLAKYYLNEDNLLKASTLINEVLQNKPKNEFALKIKNEIQIRERNSAIFREAGLVIPINKEEAQKRLESYYAANNYQFFSDLYQVLMQKEIDLEDDYHVKAGYIYLQDTRYKLSESALSRLKYKSNIDANKIRAEICYYTGKYSCAAKLYKQFYKENYSLDYALKLMNSYIFMGQTQKAHMLYDFEIRKNPKSIELDKIKIKLNKSINNNILSMKKNYEKEKTFKALNAYTNALFSSGEKLKAIDTVHDFYEKNTTKESLLLEAKYHMWAGNTSNAITLLNQSSLNDDLQAKLMLGQLYSWNQKFKKSKKNLNQVINNSKDIDLLFTAKKTRAYVYMYEKETIEAKKLFLKLQQERPKDKEVSEALMELNKDYKGLIKIYKKRIASLHKTNDVKHLGELYTLDKQPQKAIEYLKNYIDQNPNDLETTKSLALLLIANKKHSQGFGYLEYYATQKQTSDASLLLAQNYYWQGFSTEALEVLNSLLKTDIQNEEALKLKANILKLSPRFIAQSNKVNSTSNYFDDLGEKQLFLADTLYFNTHYKASLLYYQNYLMTHPNDYEAHYRYAFALEHARQYGKAEGEFSLLFGIKDSDELQYHYAYNMMKNGKLKKSKAIFLKLKKNALAPVNPNLTTFLDSWKKSWESRNFSLYSKNYNKKFLEDERWLLRKQQIFSKVKYINIVISDATSKELKENNYLIKFYQEYTTNKRADKGYKTLHIKCDSSKIECKITKETWEAGIYKRSLKLLPSIEGSLKEWEYWNLHPLSFNGERKKIAPKAKPTKYHDIVLAGGLNKDYLSEQETFEDIYTSANSIEALIKSQQTPLPSATPILLNTLNARGYIFEDSDNIKFTSLDLLYKKSKITKELSVAVDVGKMSLEEKNNVKYNGFRYGATLFYNHFSFRLGMNKFDDFSEVVPTLQYENTYKKHNYLLEYTRQNALFYTYSLPTYEKQIKADHIAITDSKVYKDKTDIWASLESNVYSNDDIEFTGQFDWRFFYSTLFLNNLSYHIALEGWYTYNTKENNDFYSPSFSDSTMFRLDPEYLFSKYLGVRGQLGIGYSQRDESTPYKYGLSVFGTPLNNISYSAGCIFSNASRLSNGPNYHTKECSADLGYSW